MDINKIIKQAAICILFFSIGVAFGSIEELKNQFLQGRNLHMPVNFDELDSITSYIYNTLSNLESLLRGTKRDIAQKEIGQQLEKLALLLDQVIEKTEFENATGFDTLLDTLNRFYIIIEEYETKLGSIEFHVQFNHFKTSKEKLLEKKYTHRNNKNIYTTEHLESKIKHLESQILLELNEVNNILISRADKVNNWCKEEGTCDARFIFGGNVFIGSKARRMHIFRHEAKQIQYHINRALALLEKNGLKNTLRKPYGRLDESGIGMILVDTFTTKFEPAWKKYLQSVQSRSEEMNKIDLFRSIHGELSDGYLNKVYAAIEEFIKSFYEDRMSKLIEIDKIFQKSIITID